MARYYVAATGPNDDSEIVVYSAECVPIGTGLRVPNDTAEGRAFRVATDASSTGIVRGTQFQALGIATSEREALEAFRRHQTAEAERFRTKADRAQALADKAVAAMGDTAQPSGVP